MLPILNLIPNALQELTGYGVAFSGPVQIRGACIFSYLPNAGLHKFLFQITPVISKDEKFPSPPPPCEVIVQSINGWLRILARPWGEVGVLPGNPGQQKLLIPFQEAQIKMRLSMANGDRSILFFFQEDEDDG